VDPIEVRSMPRWRSVPQIPCYLLGGIGCLAKDLGYAGLVLLLDEGEHFQWLTSRNLAHAANLAAGLQAVALPARVSDDMPRGGRPAHQDVPYRYRAVQHVACFVALAPQSDPGPALAALAAVPRESTTVLPPLTARHLTTLANRVLDLAGMAGVNGAPTEACRMYLTRHIQAECRAGRPLPPRRVVRLAALLPDLLAAGPVPDDPIAAWMGR